MAYGGEYTHPQTGITFPESVGGLRLGKPNDYPKGTAVPYVSEKTEIVVFIEKVDPATATAETVLAENLKTIEQFAKDGVYTDLRFYSNTGQEERAGWKRKAFSAKAKGALFLSFLYARIVGDYSMMLRVSSTDPNLDLDPALTPLQDAIDQGGKK